LRNSSKQYLIPAKFNESNALSIFNKNAKFQLNLPTETTVAVDFVRLPQNVKCPVLNNRLFNPDSVDGLLGDFAMKFLAQFF